MAKKTVSQSKKPAPIAVPSEEQQHCRVIRRAAFEALNYLRGTGADITAGWTCDNGGYLLEAMGNIDAAMNELKAIYDGSLDSFEEKQEAQS